jgi:hypothetical protein
MYLDYSKAYDSVDHNLLFQKLHSLPINKFVVGTIERIYQRNYSVVLFATGKTDPIPIQKGVRQGCPLSPLLFNLFIDDLLRKLNTNSTANGYADDILIQATTIEELALAIQILEEYNTHNKLRLNISQDGSKTVISSNLADQVA